jgi:hypothetical protein
VKGFWFAPGAFVCGAMACGAGAADAEDALSATLSAAQPPTVAATEATVINVFTFRVAAERCLRWAEAWVINIKSFPNARLPYAAPPGRHCPHYTTKRDRAKTCGFVYSSYTSFIIQLAL